MMKWRDFLMTESIKTLRELVHASSSIVFFGGSGLCVRREQLGPIEAEKFFGVAFIKAMA